MWSLGGDLGEDRQVACAAAAAACAASAAATKNWS